MMQVRGETNRFSSFVRINIDPVLADEEEFHEASLFPTCQAGFERRAPLY